MRALVPKRGWNWDFMGATRCGFAGRWCWLQCKFKFFARQALLKENLMKIYPNKTPEPGFEAVEWTGHNADEIRQFIGKKNIKLRSSRVWEIRQVDYMTVGDWMIKYQDGSISVVKSDTLKENYDLYTDDREETFTDIRDEVDRDSSEDSPDRVFIRGAKRSEHQRPQVPAYRGKFTFARAGKEGSVNWRRVPSAPIYIVSDMGLVKNPRGETLTPRMSGYNLCVRIRDKHSIPVAHLVLEAFGRPKPSTLYFIYYRDGNITNLNLSNLEWKPKTLNKVARPSLTAFSKAMRRRRVDRDITLDELSKRIGYGAPYISAIELGKQPPSAEFVKKIESVLGKLTEE